MKAHELRIGNYVFSKETQECQMIVGITLENPFIDAITFDYTTYDEIEPIPLTEQWLIDFGFEKVEAYLQGSGKYSYMDKDGLVLHTNNSGEYYAVTCPSKPIIKSVHQLQNLYFSLTEEELQL